MSQTQTQDPLGTQSQIYDSQSDLAFLDFSANPSQTNSQTFTTASQLNSQTATNTQPSTQQSNTNPITVNTQNESKTDTIPMSLPSVSHNKPISLTQTQTQSQTLTQTQMNSQLPHMMDARGFNSQSQTQITDSQLSQNRSTISQSKSHIKSDLNSITDISQSTVTSQSNRIKPIHPNPKSKTNTIELDDDDDLELEFQQFDDQQTRQRLRNSNAYMDVSQTQSQTQSESMATHNKGGLTQESVMSESKKDTLSEAANDLESVSMKPYDFNKLPNHACSYCGIHNTSCVVRCDICTRWFCNARTNASAGSHIIHHLVRSKHKRVSLHNDCPIGETSLECYNCGTRNIFLLGFVPATSDGVVVLLCRSQCLHIEKLREMEWDGSSWQPLIRDRELLDWLVASPGQIEMLRSRQISTEQMNGLEELWKESKEQSLQSKRFVDDLHLIDEQISTEKVEHVLITYEDAQHFQRVYMPLVSLEAEYDKKMKESQAQDNISIRWDIGLAKKKLIHFKKSAYKNKESIRVAPGDELLIKHSLSGWQCNGTVSKVADTDNDDDITIELRTNRRNRRHQSQNQSENSTKECTETEGFRIEFVWKSTSFDRQQFAMKTLTVDDYSVTAYLYHLLMGHEVVPQRLDTLSYIESLTLKDDSNGFSAPGLPPLNHSQQTAVQHCLLEPLSLIQGPPGTGKTVTSASIVYHLTKQSEGQTLVSAPSNIAVDQLTMKIHKTGLKVVRLSAKSREAVSSSVDFLCLHKLVIQVAEIQNSELYKWHKLKAEMGELTPKDNLRYRRLVRETEKKLLQSADVICVTCVGAGDPRLKDFRFKQVLIDESTQATEPECLIPIIMGSKQIVLVGDHCQLGPVIMCKKAAQAGLQRSLFERLILLNIKPVRLQVQYRMHPCLSQFPSNTFYQGSLQNGVDVQSRTDTTLSQDKFWPNSQMPMFFYSSMGREEFAASGTSYLNRVEAQNVEKIITKLLKLGIKPVQIGVVTPYEGQRQYIMAFMSRKGTLKEVVYDAIEVASVDAFQGREKDYIILSCVRSNNNQGIGFLNDPRRLNVALTRAKFGLIIIGNPTVLSRQNLWNNLLTHFKSFGLLVEGNLNHLKQSMIQLAQIKKYYHRRNRSHIMQMNSVMPRTFGDHIPQRRFNSINANNYDRNESLSSSQYTQHQSNAQLPNESRNVPPRMQQSPSTNNEQIRPEPNKVNNYAYPGMISQSDIMPMTADTQQSVDEVKQEKIKESARPLLTSAPLIKREAKAKEETKSDDLEIITASQIDAIRSHNLLNTQTQSTHELHLQFGSLGLTQDPQIQDIVSQMNAMNAKFEKLKNNKKSEK